MVPDELYQEEEKHCETNELQDDQSDEGQVNAERKSFHESLSKPLAAYTIQKEQKMTRDSPADEPRNIDYELNKNHG